MEKIQLLSLLADSAAERYSTVMVPFVVKYFP